MISAATEEPLSKIDEILLQDDHPQDGEVITTIEDEETKTDEAEDAEEAKPNEEEMGGKPILLVNVENALDMHYKPTQELKVKLIFIYKTYIYPN